MRRTSMVVALMPVLLVVGASVGRAAEASPPESSSASTAPAAAPGVEGDAAARARAGEIIRQMLPPETVAIMESRVPNSRFGGEFARLAYEHAYVDLWARPGLTPKERSILTIGILIGVGNEKELAAHIASGLRNGLTRQQIEEIIYHSTAYAGFPAASSALTIATKVVDGQNK